MIFNVFRWAVRAHSMKLANISKQIIAMNMLAFDLHSSGHSGPARVPGAPPPDGPLAPPFCPPAHRQAPA
jgi:hypothetical protein